LASFRVASPSMTDDPFRALRSNLDMRWLGALVGVVLTPSAARASGQRDVM
jgi:hypothetical protein